MMLRITLNEPNTNLGEDSRRKAQPVDKNTLKSLPIQNR